MQWNCWNLLWIKPIGLQVSYIFLYKALGTLRQVRCLWDSPLGLWWKEKNIGLLLIGWFGNEFPISLIVLIMDIFPRVKKIGLIENGYCIYFYKRCMQSIRDLQIKKIDLLRMQIKKRLQSPCQQSQEQMELSSSMKELIKYFQNDWNIDF